MEVLLYFAVLPPENVLRVHREKHENTGLKEVLEFLLLSQPRMGSTPK
jgi:hypothetical protein